MKVVHVCVSMLSNLPYMWARMLDELDGWSNLHIFGGDKTWNGWETDIMPGRIPKDIERAKEAVVDADIVLFYGHCHYRRNVGPINFRRLLGKKPMVQVLAVDPFLAWPHGFPLSLWRQAATAKNKIVVTADMVDAFPEAALVPIAVPSHLDAYRPSDPPSLEGRMLRVLLATTNPAVKRVAAMRDGLERLADKSSKPFQIDYITKLPHAELMQRKRESDIVLDHVSPGGWGLNGCEAGALGRPTLVRFSPAVERIYDELLGCGPSPTINTSDDPDEIAEAMLPYLMDDDLRLERGRVMAQWVEKYWSWQVRAPMLAEVLMDFAQRRPVELCG